jgi:hypothetical protein
LHEKYDFPLTPLNTEMATTPPNDDVDNQRMNTIVVGTHDDSVGMPAESLESAVANLEQQFASDDGGKNNVL